MLTFYGPAPFAARDDGRLQPSSPWPAAWSGDDSFWIDGQALTAAIADGGFAFSLDGSPATLAGAVTEVVFADEPKDYADAVELEQVTIIRPGPDGEDIV